jgi:hypothetical protein
MNALLTSPSLGLALLGLVVAAIVAMHRMTPRAVRRVVASTWLWEVAARRAGMRQSSWRWWLGLVLSLAIGALLVAALTRPEVRGDASRRVVVIVDDGPSMAMRRGDGRTRFAHAIDRARGLIRKAPGSVLVIDTMGRATAPDFTGSAEAFAALDRLTVVPAGDRVAPPLPDVPGLDVHYVGDGVELPVLPPGTIVHSVFELAGNVAVLRLVARPRPADPSRVEALVQVLNASRDAKSVRLTLRGGARYAVTQELRMAAGELVDATFDVSDFEGGVLAAAAVTTGDAFAGDDIAYAVVPSRRVRRVQLVTRGHPALADALAALPGVRLEIVDPARYRHGAAVDAYVFDGFAPLAPPDAGALLFRAPSAGWLPPADRGVGTVVIDAWDRGHPIASGIAWDTLDVRRASVWKRLPGGVATVVRAGASAVVVAGRATAPWIAVAFGASDSDLPLRPGFTVFLGQALAHLAGSDDAPTEALGTVRVALAEAEVIDGAGRRVEGRHVPGATLFEAVRPDIYTARTADARVRIAAAVLDPARAEVNRSAFAEDRRPPEAASTPPLERPVVIALACLALLLVDWAAFTRRLTR